MWLVKESSIRDPADVAKSYCTDGTLETPRIKTGLLILLFLIGSLYVRSLVYLFVPLPGG